MSTNSAFVIRYKALSKTNTIYPIDSRTRPEHAYKPSAKLPPSPSPPPPNSLTVHLPHPTTPQTHTHKPLPCTSAPSSSAEASAPGSPSASSASPASSPPSAPPPSITAPAPAYTGLATACSTSPLPPNSAPAYTVSIDGTPVRALTPTPTPTITHRSPPHETLYIIRGHRVKRCAGTSAPRSRSTRPSCRSGTGSTSARGTRVGVEG
ncbi:hypothetical protein MMC32_006981 [Xylographa parallela]|nr:hypothetical protein [Xylographa parallela]